MTNLGPLSFNNSGNPTSSLHTNSNFNTAGPNTPQIRFPNAAPPTVGAQIGGGSLDQGVNPNYRDPQSNQWNVTVEREISQLYGWWRSEGCISRGLGPNDGDVA
jgi:hypothetical protein